jgi:TRAP-type uncharacterized transport system substrate-binding protein
MKKALLVVFMVTLAVCLMTTGAQAEKKFLRMASGPQGGVLVPFGRGNDVHRGEKPWH